ncbi:unnamed protein product [Ostreobium quekettii]|uniref:Protein kinase domain-containing protein n=1 Tax=Ostreobium quekettii TaxID=121088 RepID=A0A8S1J238_9CHLO|nr:unnamed protein product [Ostreobium quekettii]|eukprot:evm.model.scf_1102.4 EVM.evm.TU.scf_1102.4   scf_1102:28674-30839(+)
MCDLGKLRRDLEVELEEDEEASLLGSGAFGSVRKGHIFLDKRRVPVAIKYANELRLKEARTSLENELRIYDRMYERQRHPHVLECFGGNMGNDESEDGDNDFEKAGEDVFIVLELMDMSLQNLIYSRKFACHRLYRTLLLVCAQIADSLEFLHDNKIIHYDIKPSNVLITEKDDAEFCGRACRFVVKLADFGVSKLRMQRSTKASFKGQIGYMAPEVVMSLHFKGVTATDKVDVYSLGILIWECVTQKDLVSESMGESVDGLTTPTSASRNGSDCFLGSSRLSMPKSVPKSLRDLIGNCVEPDPQCRPACSVVREALLKLADEPWALQAPGEPIDGSAHSTAAFSITDSAMDRHEASSSEPQCPYIDLEIEVEYPDRDSASGSVVGRGPYTDVERGVYEDEFGVRNSVVVKHAKAVQYQNLFKHELEMFGRLPMHRNIVRCYGGSLGPRRETDEDRGIFIVTEELGQSWGSFLFGNTVQVEGSKVIRSDTRYYTMLQVFHAVASALAHCHRNSIIYGNLNPQNVLLDREGRAKLTSMMFARFFSDSSSFHPEIAVVSPELLLSRFNRYQKFTEKMDVFALGAFMWGSLEIDGDAIDLVLKPPKETEDGQQLSAGCSGLRLSAHYPSELRDLVLKCTAFMEGDRPSCQEVMGRLQEMMLSAMWVQRPIFKIDVRKVSTVPWICATPPRRFAKRRGKKQESSTPATWFRKLLAVLDQWFVDNS